MAARLVHIVSLMNPKSVSGYICSGCVEVAVYESSSSPRNATKVALNLRGKGSKRDGMSQPARHLTPVIHTWDCWITSQAPNNSQKTSGCSFDQSSEKVVYIWASGLQDAANKNQKLACTMQECRRKCSRRWNQVLMRQDKPNPHRQLVEHNGDPSYQVLNLTTYILEKTNDATQINFSVTLLLSWLLNI